MQEKWPARLVVRQLSHDDAEHIAHWRYAGPWQIYNPRPEDPPVGSDQGYWAVAGERGGPLVGYCCSGAEARVPGLAPDADVLDIGVGMAPVWVGRGYGTVFGEAVLRHFHHQAPGVRLRAVVQS